ncbi:MAG: HupE/UreJ family protein [Maritimibacter sp.]
MKRILHLLGPGLRTVTRGSALSTGRALLYAIVMILGMFSPLSAHEMSPAIGDITVREDGVTLKLALSAEAMMAGIDLSAHEETSNAPEAITYDGLRSQSAEALEAAFMEQWPLLAQGFDLTVGGLRLGELSASITTDTDTDPALTRISRLTLTSPLPEGDDPVIFSWDPEYGQLILRQVVDDLAPDQDAYAALLNGGEASAPLPRNGTAEIGVFKTFMDYIVIGFEHILPKGLDHILFVLGLFFFSYHLRPLFWQVTTFTLAHSITLALATLGVVKVSGAIVEPLIAASIAFVAIENIFQTRLSRFRFAVIFAFGLLHGLGFASVLGDIGLAPGQFVLSLIAFNVGVELGQITVLLAAFLTLGIWFGKKPWYRARIAVPASAAIAVVGLWWVFERVILT